MIKILPLLLASSVSFAGGSSFLTVANDVPKEQKKLLESDLDRLSTMSLAGADANFSRVLDFSGPVTAKNLLDWLSLRIRYVVSSDMELNKSAYIEERSYSYQNAGITPDIPESSKKPGNDGGPSNGGGAADGPKVMVVMSNVGGALYIAGKSSGALLGLKIPGVGKVPASSPRVGILQVGEGLFKIRATKESKIEDVDASLMRLGTLFHEARHSDGNGKNIGMLHAICPEGHAYAGYGACDFSLNGSYSVGAHITKVLTESCRDCSPTKKEGLRLDYLDSFSRVITEKAAPGAENELQSLLILRDSCDTIKGVKGIKTPEFCKDIDQRIADAQAGKGGTIKAQYLNSSPEGKLEKHRGLFGF